LSAVAHIKDYKAGKFYQDEFRGDISWNGYEHKVLLRNEGKDANGTLQFTDIAMALGADDIKDVRGMAVADFDNDGALDIIMNTNPGDSGDPTKARPALLRNNVGAKRNWLAVELVGTQSNRDAVGAMVTIESGGAKQLRLVSAGSGFASQNTERLYFGLNDKTQVDVLTVRWPSGRIERFQSIRNQPIVARHVIRITEGTGIDQRTLPVK
jgi:enediyne biosynthesis protein E4